MPKFQKATVINVLGGKVVLCGRYEVEDPQDSHRIFDRGDGPGVIISCAGERTDKYNYSKCAQSWTKHTVPVSYNGRERNRAWGAAQVAITAALKAGGTVAPWSLQIDSSELGHSWGQQNPSSSSSQLGFRS